MNIEDLVRAHIESELVSNRKVKLELDTSLVGIVDSTGVLELAVWMEDTFGFSVEIDQISPEDFGTIRRLAEWIRKNAPQLKA